MKKSVKRTLAAFLASVFVFGAGIVAARASGVTLDLKRFIYSPATGAGPNRTVPVEVEWGPELFAKPATAAQYDPALLWLTSILANNAYFQRLTSDPVPKFFDAGRGDTEATLVKLGFSAIECKRAAGANEGGIEHYNYVTFGQQTMNVGGTAYQLVAVMLRGTIDPEEWVSDFYLPAKDYVPGFANAEQAVLAELKAYLAGHDAALPRKLLITGHSRGAGVANLLGASLNMPANKVAEKEDIYVYTFAAPNVAKESITGKPEAPGIHTNIWNFINRLDLVPHIPPANWGYGKFGRSVTLPLNRDVEALFSTYSGLKAELTNAGINADTIARLLGALSQNYYNEKIFPALKPVIKDIFQRDLETQYIDLDNLNKKSGAFFEALFGFEPDFAALYTDLKANLLRVVVYQHTSETYVARAKVMTGPHIERRDNKTKTTLGYSWFLNKEAATYEFVEAQGAVTWTFPQGRNLIDVVNNPDGSVTVTSKKTTGKTTMFFDFLPFAKPASFTIIATDVYSNKSELTVNIKMPLVLKLLGIIPVFGWIFILFII